MIHEVYTRARMHAHTHIHISIAIIKGTPLLV